jgi:hypothetical protein
MAIANVKASEDLFETSRVAIERCGPAALPRRRGPRGPPKWLGFLAARQPAALTPRSADNADVDGARAPSGGRAGPLWFCSSI